MTNFSNSANLQNSHDCPVVALVSAPVVLRAVSTALLVPRQPELALLDLDMPIIDGYEAARLIRNEPWGKKMVLAALTGWGQEEDKRRSKEAGFDHHFIKPINPSILRQLLAD